MRSNRFKYAASCFFTLLLSSLLIGQTWIQGDFEIHVFQVGQADSQLIVSPTGETLLIDLGETRWNSTRNVQSVAQKIQAITGGTHLDYMGGQKGSGF